MVVELSVSGTIEKGFPVNLVVPNWKLSNIKHQHIRNSKLVQTEINGKEIYQGG